MSCYMLRRWKWCLRPDFGLDFTNHPTLAHLLPHAQGLYEYRSHISQWAQTVRRLTCGTMAKHFPLLWQFAMEKLEVCGQIYIHDNLHWNGQILGQILTHVFTTLSSILLSPFILCWKRVSDFKSLIPFVWNKRSCLIWNAHILPFSSQFAVAFVDVHLVWYPNIQI